jgi:hypothetical protein
VLEEGKGCSCGLRILDGRLHEGFKGKGGMGGYCGALTEDKGKEKGRVKLFCGRFSYTPLTGNEDAEDKKFRIIRNM